VSPDGARPLVTPKLLYNVPGLEFSRLESWSRDVSRLNFQSLGLGLGLEA